MKRITTLLAIFLITHVPFGCADDCGSFTPMEARISDLGATVGSFSSNEFSTSTNEDFSLAAIQVTIEEMDYSAVAGTLKRNLSLIGAVYACIPPEPEPTQAIVSIEITSTSSVFLGNQEYPAGENLVDFFSISKYANVSSDTTIDEFIQLQKNDLWLFGYQGDHIVFQLSEKPDEQFNQQFYIKFKFSDSEEVTAEIPNFAVSNQSFS